MTKKIVIIGAGPIGCYTAQLLKKYGFDPLIIEEHSEVGRPIHCTGLVGSRVFDEKRPYSLPSASIINTINGAVIYYGDQSFVIERKKVAYVIDRERFDKDLSKGLPIIFENKFLGLEEVESGYIVETNKDEIPAGTVIGADGANSVVRRVMGQELNASNYKGVQFRMKAKPRHKDMVEVYIKRPSFFWIVPESDEVIRVGTISDNPYKELQAFLKEHKLKGEVIERFGGLVSIGICSNTARNNIALVGDAACQVKPLTYGGIYFGLNAATILADCLRKDRLADYDHLWKKELASEIRIGLKVKQVYDSLSDDEVMDIYRAMKSHRHIIEKMGDFESHSSLIMELLKTPSLYPQLGSLIKIFFNKILS